MRLTQPTNTQCSMPHAQLPTINHILKSAIAPFVIAAMALSVALGK